MCVFAWQKVFGASRTMGDRSGSVGVRRMEALVTCSFPEFKCEAANCDDALVFCIKSMSSARKELY